MHQSCFTRIVSACCTLALGVVLVGCASSKKVPEGSYSLEGVKLVADNSDLNTDALMGYVRQRPAPKLFSLFKKPGAAPVIYDTLQVAQTKKDLQMAMQNMGYLHAGVEVENSTKGNKVRTTYKLSTGEPFYLSDFTIRIQDDSLREVLKENIYKVDLPKNGDRFSVSMLNDLRKHITSYLTDNGYYRFHKDFIDFNVDTAANSTNVGVGMNIYKYRENNNDTPRQHPVYHIRKINYLSGGESNIHLRRRHLVNNTAFAEGDLYSATALQKTYNNFARLQAVRYTNIRFTEVPDTTLLDCDIQISTNKPSSISFQPEGTNTNGDLGAAASLTYENRNLFHGSELLSLQARAAFEAITGLEGYQDQNYQEYGLEAKLLFPRLLAPFLSSEYKRTTTASSELVGGYNLQNRPEFHRRLFSASWRYRWTSGKTAYRFDLLDLNYIYMPWISETFKEDYLDSETNRNAILRYNYEDLFIMKIGLGMNFTHKNYALRTNIETAGNLLNGVSRLARMHTNDEGKYTLFNIAFAQYVKGDIDYTKLFNFDENNQLAVHASLGIAYPYGNSNMLPFEKRYFSGGANSVRGWSVRSLGPGNFRGTDGRIDFINQTGDIKLDMSLEYRTKLFWKFSGAAFVDAGNIWTIRAYDEQPGGQFRFDKFYNQIAASYGLGLRLNFDYFVLRFDCAMKAVNPVYETAKQHFPVISPDFGRDFAFHFAVGLPF